MNFFIFLHMFQSGHSVSEYLVVTSLTTTSRSDQHQTVTHLNSVEQLNNLVNKRLFRLQLADQALFG
jgi:hypothetical protein